jgi:hypothetical protein
VPPTSANDSATRQPGGDERRSCQWLPGGIEPTDDMRPLPQTTIRYLRRASVKDACLTTAQGGGSPDDEINGPESG